MSISTHVLDTMRGTPAAGLGVSLHRREPDGDWKEVAQAETDSDGTHPTGDNSKVVPTDTQKNTVFAFAREPIGEIEDFGIRLARHFVNEFASVYRARVSIQECAWERISAEGKPHDHAFVRAGSEQRLASVTCTDGGTWVVGGIGDLVGLK